MARLTARTSLVGVLAIVLTGLSPTPGQAVASCGASAGYQICVNAPGSVLSGNQTIGVTVSGSSAGIYEMNFAWGSSTTSTNQLMSDFEAPWGFVWRTDRYLDATQYLNVRVKTSETAAGTPVSIALTLQNGNITSVPSNPSDWASLFQARPAAGDPVFAAVGDGADGRARSKAVAASIASSTASLFLYLGDVYERGTPAELDANYGRASFDTGGTWDWGALARWTVPTVGNHEVANLATWRDYWHGIPLYQTFVAGGVRFFDLDSECASVGGCGVGSPQYNFVQQALQTNTYPCVVAFWHRPVLGGANPSSEMRALWALLANSGGDLVLNGHTHDMEAYAPLDPNLAAGQPGSHMVQLVAGSGGHAFYPTASTDPRDVWHALKTPGAVFITAVGGATGQSTRLDWVFKTANGDVVTTAQGQGRGSVPCGGVAETDPPTPPGKPMGSSPAPGSITIGWSASLDASPPITYRVYRDGDLSTPVGTTTSTTFTDTGLAPASQHTYTIGAADTLGNGPTFGPASDPITVASASAAFSDDFSSGTFSSWSGVTRLTIDQGTGGAAPPSAKAQTVSQSAFAFANLSTTVSTVCMSQNVNATSRDPSATTLLRLRTAANGPIARVFVNAGGILYVRSDAAGTQVWSGVALGTGWHSIEVCGSVGSASSWDLYRDGVRIVNGWTANTGTAPVGRVEIGNAQAVTATVNFDDVVVDQAPGA